MHVLAEKHSAEGTKAEHNKSVMDSESNLGKVIK